MYCGVVYYHLRIGMTTFRPKSRVGDQPVRIREHDRLHHLYIVGRTGVGKSTLLRNLIYQDLAAGQGSALLDPHGDLVESVVAAVPDDRRGDVVFLDVPDPSCHIAFNPFADAPRERHPLVAASLVEAFQKIWSEDWGPRLEHVLRNILFALLAVPGATLADAPVLLSDRKARHRMLQHVENEEVKSFWRDEYDRYSPNFRAVVAAPLQNKLGALLTDPRLKEILTGEKSSFDLRKIMDEGRILLVNLSKGQIGEGPSTLLGSLLVSAISQAALERAKLPEKERRPFWLYLDEFQTFSTLSLATMLSELRKYKVGLTLAHQYLSQLDSQVRDAALSNAGTLISFRLGAHDARYLAPEFAPVFEPVDLLSLPNHHVYLRLMIEGEVSRPFSARTLV